MVPYCYAHHLRWYWYPFVGLLCTCTVSAGYFFYRTGSKRAGCGLSLQYLYRKGLSISISISITNEHHERTPCRNENVRARGAGTRFEVDSVLKLLANSVDFRRLKSVVCTYGRVIINEDSSIYNEICRVNHGGRIRPMFTLFGGILTTLLPVLW